MKRYIVLLLLAVNAIVLIALQMKSLGWILLGTTTILLLFTEKHFRRDMLLVVGALGILGLTEINTDISLLHILQMGTPLLLAIILPFIITRYMFKENTIRFPFHHGRKWYRKEIMYIFITAAIAYLILPFYLRNTGAYLNWTVEPGADNLFMLFLGTNGLGTWDEFFFVSTVLAILRKHFSFWMANAAQAVLFTSFLFELGFIGWAPFAIYPFALAQGYIFRKTDSLLYVITIHLTLDLILYLALINAHHPGWLQIFIT
ncbi:MAG: CPBP family intramembrane glutamic endopeptidase [Patescibacteria group bacterium]